MNGIPIKPISKRNRQQGAVAVEFAILFVLFFSVFYAIIAYSIPLLLTLSFKHLSAEAARASLKVDPTYYEAYEDYLAKVNQVINEVVADSWLPDDWISGGCPPPAEDWTPINSGPYGFIDPTGVILDVCLQRRYDWDTAIIPMLRIGGLTVPALPDTLRGRTSFRLQ